MKSVRSSGARENQADQSRAQQARHDTERYADQALETNPRDTPLQYDREHSERRSHQGSGPEWLAGRTEVPGAQAQNDNEYCSENDEIQHGRRPPNACCGTTTANSAIYKGCSEIVPFQTTHS